MTLRTDILPEELTERQTIVVHEVLSSFQELNVSDFLPPGTRSRQLRPAQDINSVYSLIKTVIDEKQEEEQIPEKHRVLFLEDFPPGDLTTEIITFGLVGRYPGAFGKGPALQPSVKEVKPHYRGSDIDETMPGHLVITSGQFFDNEIALTCWAKTNKQANIRARWLEDTLRDFTWFIRYSGVSHFFFLGQGEDLLLKLDSTENTLKGRPLTYFVRTERLTHVREPTIRRLVVKYGLGE